VLRGRPFGGVSILVRDVYKAAVCIHRSADRFVVLSIGNVVFVNLYLPNYRSQPDVLLTADLLDNLIIILADIQYYY